MQMVVAILKWGPELQALKLVAFWIVNHVKYIRQVHTGPYMCKPNFLLQLIAIEFR